MMLIILQFNNLPICIMAFSFSHSKLLAVCILHVVPHLCTFKHSLHVKNILLMCYYYQHLDLPLKLHPNTYCRQTSMSSQSTLTRLYLYSLITLISCDLTSFPDTSPFPCSPLQQNPIKNCQYSVSSLPLLPLSLECI